VSKGKGVEETQRGFRIVKRERKLRNEVIALLGYYIRFYLFIIYQLQREMGLRKRRERERESQSQSGINEGHKGFSPYFIFKEKKSNHAI
jgi:hypothetical protein